MYLSLMRSSLPLRLELRQETRLTEDFRVYERNEKPLYHRGTPTSPLEPAGKGGKTKKSPSFLSIKGGEKGGRKPLADGPAGTCGDGRV